MALHTVFTLSLSMVRFELTRDVTYGQYVSALNSGLVRATGLLPPDFPNVSVSFQYATHHTRPYHPHCRQSCHGRPLHNVSSGLPDTIRDLYVHRDQYWCAGGDRLLFF
jgi:hypothetical protein